MPERLPDTQNHIKKDSGPWRGAAVGKTEGLYAQILSQTHTAIDCDPVLCDIHHLCADALSARFLCGDDGAAAVTGTRLQALRRVAGTAQRPVRSGSGADPRLLRAAEEPCHWQLRRQLEVHGSRAPEVQRGHLGVLHHGRDLAGVRAADRGAAGHRGRYQAVQRDRLYRHHRGAAGYVPADVLLRHPAEAGVLREAGVVRSGGLDGTRLQLPQPFWTDTGYGQASGAAHRNAGVHLHRLATSVPTCWRC